MSSSLLRESLRHCSPLKNVFGSRFYKEIYLVMSTMFFKIKNIIEVRLWYRLCKIRTSALNGISQMPSGIIQG